MPIELSVVIITYRRDQVLLDTIEYLLAIPGPRAEIIVVDQTEQHTPQALQQLEAHDRANHIRWICRSSPGITPSMNCGAEAAKGDILLFLDDDIVPDPQLLAAHASAHQSARGALIAGRVLQPWHGDAHDSDPFTLKAGEYKEEFIGCNFSIGRDLLMSIGGFDENFKGAAYYYERELADRLLESGHRIWYEPTAVIRHLHHGSGGTRSKGDHLTSWNPHHPVGAYYYLLVSRRLTHRARKSARRFFRSVMTRHHLRRPWYIPVTLVSELLGLCWAICLRIKGPALPFLPRIEAKQGR